MTASPPAPSAPAEAPAAPEPARPRSAFYRACWRWHFYAGLLCIPLIALLSLSGIVWLFKPQIDGIAYRDMMRVEASGPRVSYDRQLTAVRAAYPGGSVTRMATPERADRSTVFDVTTERGGSRTVYVDPHTARVLGARNNDRAFTQLALELHGSLLTGRWLGSEDAGDKLLEIVAGWSLVLVVTGTVLWWPRGRRRSLRAALTPRLRGLKRRTTWRDIHAITGVTFAFVTVFFLITGLMWTGGWGKRYSDVATRLGASYPPMLRQGVDSKPIGDALASGKAGWTASQLPVQLSGEPGNPHTHAGHHGSGHVHGAGGVSLDMVVARAERAGFAPGYAIFMPEDANGSYSAVTHPDIDVRPNQSALDGQTTYIDQHTGEELATVRFGDYGVMAKATDFGIALHEGRQWGLWSQLLMLLGTLAILVSLATSVVMWRKRKPAGLGAPRRPPSRRATLGMLALVGGLGLMFPLLGYSLLAVLALELLVLRRIKPLARALGAA